MAQLGLACPAPGWSANGCRAVVFCLSKTLLILSKCLSDGLRDQTYAAGFIGVISRATFAMLPTGSSGNW